MNIILKVVTTLAFLMTGILFYFAFKGMFSASERNFANGAMVEGIEKVAQLEPMSDEEKEGDKLFQQNCSSCHKIKGNLVGPGLEGVSEKYSGDEEWLYNWIRNAPKLIQEQDPKAVALYEQYNKKQMSSFSHLSDDQISAILSYITYESS